jgi:hypothetical protein
LTCLLTLDLLFELLEVVVNGLLLRLGTFDH